MRLVEIKSGDIAPRPGFPEMQGLSSRNLQFMRGFAAEFPDETIVKQLVSQLPGGTRARRVSNQRCITDAKNVFISAA
jgi:hypothetical protein